MGSNPTASAKHFTLSFSKDIEYLEGVYASDWDTKTLVYTNPKSVGIVTRPTEEGRDFFCIML